MTNGRNTTVVRAPTTPDAERTLLCLGFCGGGTGPYLEWADVLPPRTGLAAVCYPGREGRFGEECADGWDALAEDATAAVLDAADRPYVLFGHSMGGWMAFEVTARIEALGGPPPEALVVSSCNAPSDGVRDRDRFPAQQDGDEEVLDWMRTHGLLPGHVLDDPFLRELAVALMRADMRVRDDLHHREGTRVSVPLQVLTGTEDEGIDPEVARKWRALSTGGFRHDALPGGHFFVPEVWAALPRFMAPLR